jgi:hypothetical protein
MEMLFSTMVITLGLPSRGSHPHALIVTSLRADSNLDSSFFARGGAVDPRAFRDDYYPGTVEPGQDADGCG